MWMSFAIIGRTGPGMRQVVGFEDRSTGTLGVVGVAGGRNADAPVITFAIRIPGEWSQNALFVTEVQF